MIAPDDPLAILDRLKTGNPTAADVELVRQLLTPSAAKDVVQLGKYNVNIGEGKDIHVGDRIYQGANAEAIRDIIQSVLQELHATAQPGTPELKSVDELVQEVRSRIHDDIQLLHGMMPLWGVDHWVPLGDLFVDVNILEEVSSNRRSELADLWQDFSQSPSYRGLDRMGLGKERQRVSGLEVLDRNTNLMVVGKPGSGKTTYLQRVVTECNAGNLQAHRIPVLIQLREFVEDGREVDYSVERYLERCWRLSDQAVRLVLGAGRSLVLLDGLDEVTGADGQAITKQIKRFARDYPQVQAIVTCRTQSQESRFERFDYVEVADFNEPQVRAFAEHWFQTVCRDFTVGQAKAKAFLDQLFQEENRPIRELAITPILLSLTCAVFQQTGKFYSKRSQLYEEGLELLLEQWDRSREIERDEIYRGLSVEGKLELLSYLAVKKFVQEHYVLFEQAEIEGYIAEFLGIGLRESRGVLRAIEAQHGLLIERSQKVWSFSHLTFQEYLVAKWFSDQTLWKQFVSYIHYKNWREIFLLVTEMLPNSDELLLLIKAQLDTFLSQEGQLKEFLIYLNQKSLSANLPYQQSTKRACYFAMELCPDKVLDNPLNPDFSLPRILETRFNQTLGKYYVPGYIGALANDTALDLAVDLALILQLKTAIDFNEYPVEELAYIFDLAFDLRINLDQLLYDLREELPDSNDLEDFHEWWRNNGLSWSERLRAAINSYRLVGYDWKFTEEQKLKLKSYHNGNLTLIYCLNGKCMVGESVRKIIEETLMLPLFEIEKHSCDQDKP